mmetsp:Transcript_118456/g.368927  ORF Transcript_118456/g.368927 Transcript_118456/m.368927 type:complete len:461 (-) Transcript_118456:451-1833(-)
MRERAGGGRAPRRGDSRANGRWLDRADQEPYALPLPLGLGRGPLLCAEGCWEALRGRRHGDTPWLRRGLRRHRRPMGVHVQARPRAGRGPERLGRRLGAGPLRSGAERGGRRRHRLAAHARRLLGADSAGALAGPREAAPLRHHWKRGGADPDVPRLKTQRRLGGRGNRPAAATRGHLRALRARGRVGPAQHGLLERVRPGLGRLDPKLHLLQHARQDFRRLPRGRAGLRRGMGLLQAATPGRHRHLQEPLPPAAPRARLQAVREPRHHALAGLGGVEPDQMGALAELAEREIRPDPLQLHTLLRHAAEAARREARARLGHRPARDGSGALPGALASDALRGRRGGCGTPRPAGARGRRGRRRGGRQLGGEGARGGRAGGDPESGGPRRAPLRRARGVPGAMAPRAGARRDGEGSHGGRSRRRGAAEESSRQSPPCVGGLRRRGAAARAPEAAAVPAAAA